MVTPQTPGESLLIFLSLYLSVVYWHSIIARLYVILCHLYITLDIFYFQVNSTFCNVSNAFLVSMGLSKSLKQRMNSINESHKHYNMLILNVQVWIPGWSSPEKEWDTRNNLTRWSRSMELLLVSRRKDSFSDLNSSLPFSDRYGRDVPFKNCPKPFLFPNLSIYYRALSDTDSDGKMDINEFSIACKLINLKLRGFEIPKVLPPILIQSLKSFSTGRWIVLCIQEMITSRNYITKYFRRS